MLLSTLFLPLAAALPVASPLASPATPQPQGDSQAPPGLVLIPGGKTEIGIDKKEVERLLDEYPPLRSTASLFVGETPKKEHRIGDFFLMLNEVTNEQYAAYVSATGARPPYHWAEEALEAATKSFLDEQGAARAAAIAAGEKPPKMEKFEKREWWAQNWRGQPWAVPADLELSPVVFVDYQDARGYARWAGLRLMTELEYQRACRGDTDNAYPWGDKWEDGKYAATQEVGNRSEAMPMGSFPDGASPQGVMDLAGNVWEWTSSSYVPLEGYKFFKLTFGRGKNKEEYDHPPPFNPDHRSVVGGSIQNPRFMARCTTRGGFDRFQQASALGFRCAASPQLGLDMAETLARDVPVEQRPKNQEGPLKYDPRLTLAMDRWVVAPSNAQMAEVDKASEAARKASQMAEATGKEPEPVEDPAPRVPGYDVISGYEYILFLPIEKVFGVAVKDLRETSLEEGLVPLGLFATDQELIDPAIPPGTYIVSLRGAGETEPPPPPVEKEDKKKKKKKGKKDEPEPEPEEEVEEEEEAEPGLEELIQIDLEVDNFVLFDLEGNPVCAIPCESLSKAAAQANSVKPFDKTVIKMVGEEEVEEIQKWLALEIYLPGRTNGKGFLMKLPLRFADGVIEGNWRK